jgi:membrane protease subunit HflC
MNLKFAIVGVVLVLGGILLSDTFFTVDETQQALVLQFGEYRRTVQDDPGLHVKVPFLQNVVYYEDRVLNVDPPVQQVILADQRRLNVDSFALYRIANPLRFFEAVRNEVTAEQRISTFVNASLRSVLGNRLQIEVLSEERANIMDQIRTRVAREAEALGIEIVDVRIGRADVPEGTVRAVYERMRSEREREAAEFRAQGQEQAQQIRARADRERAVLLAEAGRRAQILRGQGDSQAIRIQAEAHNLDPSFFGFYRSLQAYRTSMPDEATTMVLAPQGEFFRYFQDISGGSGELPSRVEEPEQMRDMIRQLLVSIEEEVAPGGGPGPGGSSLDPELLEALDEQVSPEELRALPDEAGGAATEDGAGTGEPAEAVEPEPEAEAAPPAGEAPEEGTGTGTDEGTGPGPEARTGDGDTGAMARQPAVTATPTEDGGGADAGGSRAAAAESRP